VTQYLSYQPFLNPFLTLSSKLALRSLSTTSSKVSEEEPPTDKGDSSKEVEKLTADIATWTEKFASLDVRAEKIRRTFISVN
jgi:hypothetical protein